MAVLTMEESALRVEAARAMPMSSFSGETTSLGSTRGLRGCHLGSPRVTSSPRIRRNESPEVTGGDSSRQLPITRNEGVPGSSPGVGFRPICREFCRLRQPLAEAFGPF